MKKMFLFFALVGLLFPVFAQTKLYTETDVIGTWKGNLFANRWDEWVFRKDLTYTYTYKKIDDSTWKTVKINVTNGTYSRVGTMIILNIEEIRFYQERIDAKNVEDKTNNYDFTLKKNGELRINDGKEGKGFKYHFYYTPEEYVTRNFNEPRIYYAFDERLYTGGDTLIKVK